MENPNYAQVLSERILSLRKEKGLTQEALAQQLGVSFQAVSKWENEQSCPDIALLPLLADIFEVTIDSLFGRLAPEAEPVEEESAADTTARHEPEWGDNPVFSTCADLPWPDDRTLRGVLFWGHKLLSHQKPKPWNKIFTFDVNKSEYTWLLRYSPLNVQAECALRVEGDVQGNAGAGGSLTCGDVGGDANAGGSLTCGDIGKNANAGGGLGCGDIGRDANAGGGLACGDIGNNANAGGGINCGDIDGDANAGGGITCGDIGGDATAGNEIKCGDISGDAEAGTEITCGDIGGDAKAKKIVMKK